MPEPPKRTCVTSHILRIEGYTCGKSCIRVDSYVTIRAKCKDHVTEKTSSHRLQPLLHVAHKMGVLSHECICERSLYSRVGPNDTADQLAVLQNTTGIHDGFLNFASFNMAIFAHIHKRPNSPRPFYHTLGYDGTFK